MLRKKVLLIFAILIVVTLMGCEDTSSEVVHKEKSHQSKAIGFQDNKEHIKLIEYKKEKAEEAIKNKPIIITATGDIMLGRGVGSRLGNSDMNLAYKNLKSEFDRADIVFGNLENPISNRGRKLPGKGICLRADPAMVQVLKEGGFDIVSLANNHILDYDSEALLDTLQILDENGIGYAGAGENIEEARAPYIYTIKDRSIAVFAYDEFAHYYYSNSYKRRFQATEILPGTAPMNEDMILEDIKNIREKVDIILVSLHWGIEESNNITKEQRRLAHILIDNGVDAILGHHPHVIQPIEIYNNKPIIYSMGNYIFDQNDENNKQGMVISLILDNEKIREVEALPIYIKDKREPIIAEGEKGEIIRNKIISLSRELESKGQIKGNKVIFNLY